MRVFKCSETKRIYQCLAKDTIQTFRTLVALNLKKLAN